MLTHEKLLSQFVIAEIRSANGVGDVLGFKHLDLPFVPRGTKCAYLIQAASWTSEEKHDFDQKSHEGQRSVIEKVIGEFLVYREA